MADGAGPGGPETGPGSKPASSVEVAGGRVRFTVQLTAGETTIVSWKKLLKEANLTESGQPGPSVSGPSSEAQSAFISEPLPPPLPAEASHAKKTMENESKESQANRLNNVIERIERMYAGNGSSDEEDLVLDDKPDDDEYDTEDSFIDDTELDDYFQVDNSTIKHDGFFVNRGKLEHIEPTISMDQQGKKRRRKDLVQGGGSDGGQNLHEGIKMGNKGRKTSSSIPRSSAGQMVDMLVQDPPANPTEFSVRKTTDIQFSMDPSGLQNDVSIRQQMPGFNSYGKHIGILKESELQNTSTQNLDDKASHAGISYYGEHLDNIDGLDLSIQRKEKGGHVERLNLGVAASKASLPAVKDCPMERTESSSARPKTTNLEKAFKELEKIVEQFRPPSTEPQDPANQSQSVRRRLPPEIKLKLAKVARIAGSIYGQIPKDVTNRLMSILGHLIQITTLKRNLRAMAKKGLLAKQQKDDQIQKIKQEVAEMVKLQTMRMKSKLEQYDANSDDFQEADPEEREALKRKHSMDNELENKICDLYDLYVERLEEDSGPPVRKLYEELALLWPSGFMQTDGIKRAIYRAKDRKGLFNYRKDQEGLKKKKKVSASNTQDASNATQTTNTHENELSHDRGSTLDQEGLKKKKKVSASNAQDASNATQTTNTHEIALSHDRGSAMDQEGLKKKKKKVSASNAQDVSNASQTTNSHGKMLSHDRGSTLVSHAVPFASVTSSKGSNPGKSKKGKTEKRVSSRSPDPADPKPSDVVVKKKVKRKPNAEVAEAELHLEKLVISQGDETTQTR